MGYRHFNEDHQLFRESFRAFLAKEVIPNIDQWEEERKVPKSIWKKMGDMGYLGLSYPEEYGGSGLDFFYDVIFSEELGLTNSGGFTITQQVTQYMAGPYILKYGSDTLKKKYIPGIVSGDMICSIGITEPSAGSDVQNIQTKAVRDGDHYIINGSKTFITNGVYGDFIITVCKTDSNAGSAGISLIVIDRQAEGVSARKLKKLGWHASDTAELSFDNVKAPVENLVGEEGNGFYYLMNGLQLERIIGLPGAITAMENALKLSMQYMSERHAFGRPIQKFQVLRHRIAQLSSEVEAQKAFVYHCCDLYASGDYDVKLCSMAKLLVSELCEKVATQCLQFYGGYGFMEEYPMARFYRDVRVGTIGGGTSEVMREIIAKMVMDDVQYEQAERKSDSKDDGLPAFEQIVSRITSSAGKAKALGNTVKFKLGDQQIFINGNGGQNEVSTEDLPSDCTVDMEYADFVALISGKLNPMKAMTSGKLKLSGDMGVAMKMQQLFG